MREFDVGIVFCGGVYYCKSLFISLIVYIVLDRDVSSFTCGLQ